jgi:hypothetical protein
MLRQVRLDALGALHHVMGRKPERRSMFWDDIDCVCFATWRQAEVPRWFG